MTQPGRDIRYPSRHPPPRVHDDAERTLPRPAVKGPRASSTNEIAVDDILEVRPATAPRTSVPSPRAAAPSLRAPAPAARPRPRPAPAATQEIDAGDVLEVIERDRRPATQPGQHVADVTPSLAPFAIDVDVDIAPMLPPRERRPDSTFVIEEAPRPPRRKLGWVVGTVLLGATSILMTAMFSAPAQGGATDHRAAARAPITSTRATRSPSAASSAASTATTTLTAPSPSTTISTTTTATTRDTKAAAPVVDVSSLPRAPVGTLVKGASTAGHRVFVDGALLAAPSTVLACGKHTVRIGRSGKAQTVVVPCGGEATVGH